MIKKEIEGAALLSIYNELKDEIKAIRTDIQHLHIQQPQQSENNQELNSLLKETIVNAVNDTINAYINSRGICNRLLLNILQVISQKYGLNL